MDQKSRVSSLLFMAAAFVVVVAGMRAAEPILVPFLLSAFIAIISIPLLFWLENKGLPRWFAMLTVIGGLIAIGAGVIVLVGSSIREFSQNLPEYKIRINSQALPLMEWLRARGIEIPTDGYMSYLEPEAAIQLTADLLNGFGKILSNAFLIVLTTVFILFETSSFPRKFRTIMKNPDFTLDQFAIFRNKIRHYLVIKTITSLSTAVMVGLSLALLGVNYPVLWGLLSFFLNYVPNVGSIIAAIPAVLFAIIQLGVVPAMWVALSYVVVNIVIGSIIEPRFMGRGLGLSALVVFLSLVFWGWLLGPVGMFLSVPLTVMFKIALDSHPETKWIAVWLGPENACKES
ncbi:MAG: AI-2E family transporter [Bacteriovoracales bacterium]|nr:AI-2E family transporter [Bacteriovoracales bacterium]